MSNGKAHTHTHTVGKSTHNDNSLWRKYSMNTVEKSRCLMDKHTHTHAQWGKVHCGRNDNSLSSCSMNTGATPPLMDTHTLFTKADKRAND